jgi:flavorubredoxin
MIKMAKEFGLEVQEPGIELKWVPTAEELKKCFEFGQVIGQKIKA